MVRNFVVLSWLMLTLLPALPYDAVAQSDGGTIAPLTLEKALDRALRESPVLAAFSWELRAADARVQQAGLRPNPVLSLEAEEIPLGSRDGGTARKQALHGSLTGGAPSFSFEREREGGDASIDDAVLTVRLSQAIELGRKRARRAALAEEQRALSRWDYETARADVLAETAHAFVDALAAQDRVALQRELLDIATEVERTFGARVRAGQVSPLERSRAEVARASAAIALDLAERSARSARAALASQWAGGPEEIGSLAGRLDSAASVPESDQLAEAIQASPDLARWATEMAERSARVDLARARRIPDMEIAVGVESGVQEGGSARGFELESGGGFTAFRSEGSGRDREYSLKFEVSLPLPLFDRNQGNIAAARHLASKASEERRAATARALRAAIAAREDAAGALEESETIETDVLATASSTFRKTQIGYREGKFGYLDVLDAQRTLFDVRARQLDALARYHHAMIDLERLTSPAPAAASEDTLHENQ